MIRYWYDTEFLETGDSIDLISIGIVASDGREYYAVNEEINAGKLHSAIRRHRWLMDNVVPHLPLIDGFYRSVPDKSWDIGVPVGRFELDPDHPAVMPREQISEQARDFLLRPNEPMELWAYYGACDHLALMWLWGPVSARPEGVPMITMDVVQLARSLGVDDANLPQQTGQVHNALDDARWTRDAWRYLTGAAGRMAGRES